MALLALDIILALLGVRGHIPRFDDFRPAPAPAADGAPLVPVIAVIVAVFAVLTLAVWLTVWFAVQIL